MLNIRSDQLQHLTKVLDDKWIAQAVEEVWTSLGDEHPELVKGFAESRSLEVVRQVINVAITYGIWDLDAYFQWAYLRLASGDAFYDHPEVREYLDDLLVHPDAKARNVALAAAMNLRRK